MKNGADCKRWRGRRKYSRREEQETLRGKKHTCGEAADLFIKEAVRKAASNLSFHKNNLIDLKKF